MTLRSMPTPGIIPQMSAIRFVNSQKIIPAPSLQLALHSSYTIQIEKLPESITHEKILEVASLFGDVIFCKPIFQHNRTIYQVLYKSKYSAQTAISEFNKMEINERKIYASFLEPENRASMSVLVKGIPSKVSIDSLLRQFQRFGDVVGYCPTKLDSPRWRCSISYQTYESAISAVAGMNKQVMMQDTKPITVIFSRKRFNSEVLNSSRNKHRIRLPIVKPSREQSEVM
ncbi:RNA-binding protein [Tritrichomonas foetus]|uniref:RNA-binding protein n=1 Tax=Tritrichomonas foetus TaxID=1144522 RepID=A0A1J4JMQ5_9EUKA|nr:RNA-binding protein [Tritrichomonas foetus]|eukprot:OHS98829.1 RNA-binding protein [Tritrichomonas foetus]